MNISRSLHTHGSPDETSAGMPESLLKKDMRIVVTSGPLAGYAGRIHETDRVTNRAIVLLDMFGTIKFDLSCELVRAE